MLTPVDQSKEHKVHQLIESYTPIISKSTNRFADYFKKVLIGLPITSKKWRSLKKLLRNHKLSTDRCKNYASDDPKTQKNNETVCFGILPKSIYLRHSKQKE